MGSTGAPPLKTYLNLLPEDMLRKIWGIAFDTPRTDPNHDSTLISRLSLMSSSSSPFSSFAPEHVNQLTLDVNEEAIGGLDTVLLNSAVVDRSPEFTQHIIRHCGSKFTKLQVYSVLHFTAGEARCFAASVACHCPAVRVLDLAWLQRCRPWRVTVDKLLEMLGGQLDALGVNCQGDPDGYTYNSPSSDDSIQSGGTDISEREFARYAVPRIASACHNLKTFSFSGTNLAVLSPLWDHIGATIEELVLRGESLYPSWHPVIDELEIKCRKLRSISLTGDQFDNEQFAAFLGSYGSQLKEADIGDLETGLCELVVQSCPNIQCSVVETGDDLPRLKSLGSHLRKLVITIENEFDPDLLTAISKDCTEIASITAESDSVVDFIPFMFAGEKRKLTYVKLDCNNVLDPDSLDTMAKMTGELKIMIMNEVPIKTFEEFDMLAEKNPKLEDVDILPTSTFDFSIFAHIRLSDMATGVANSFKDCKKLKSIKIRTEDSLEFVSISRWSVIAKPFLQYSLRGIKVHLFGAPLRPFVVY